MSSRGSVTYGVVKELARILKPLTGNTIHHVNNSMESADDIKKIKLEEGECIISYDVSALFTSIPVKSAIELLRRNWNRIQSSIREHQCPSVTSWNCLSFVCVTPTSYMEFFEDRALTSAVNPPRWWKRYVDDTFVILKQSHREEFLQHINFVDPSIQFTFNRGNTLKSLLIFPKDKEESKTQSNIIYWYKCGRTECDDEYIGESARTFEDRYKEHLKAPSPIFEHNNATGHTTSVENFKIIGRKGHGMARTIKEAIYIRVNSPTLNRNVVKYNLLHIWDKVLFSIPEVKIK